jgi:hypothetical protein
VRGLLRIMITVALLGGSVPAAADYVSEVVDRWRENTQAKPPNGLGPIKFGMTPSQLKRLCRRGWEPPKPVGNLLREHTAGCHRLPIDLGFEEYELTFHFYQNRLVSVALITSFVDGPGSNPFAHARSTLSSKYGNVPDRTDEYRNSDNPVVQKILDGWGSIYEWRFKRSEVHVEAVKIELVRFTLEGVPSMLLTYDSQQRQDRRDELSQQQAPRAQNAY